MNTQDLSLFADLNRPLPEAQEAEKGVLQVISGNPARLAQVRGKVTPDAFFHRPYRLLYEAFVEMSDADQPIDLITVTQRLRSAGTLEAVGGPGEVSQALLGFAADHCFAQYFELLVEAWTLRKAILGHGQAMRRLFNHKLGIAGQPGVSAVIAECGELVVSAVEGSASADERTQNMTECVLDHLDYMEALKTGAALVYPIGIPSFDKRARGIAGDEYCLLTGPTKGGKSTLAQKIFQRTAAAGVMSVYYTGEVSPRTLGGRAVFATGHVPASLERTGMVTHEDEIRYQRGANEVMHTIGRTGLVVNAAGMTIEQVISDMKQKYERGARLFLVDYIGKFYSAQKFSNREREISHMSHRLFDFTKRPGKPSALICLAQLNDAGEVRDCRGLEHDCDMHLKIARVFLRSKNHDDPPAEVPTRRTLIVERGRSIESGYRIPIYFEGMHYKFEECVEEGG